MADTLSDEITISRECATTILAYIDRPDPDANVLCEIRWPLTELRAALSAQDDGWEVCASTVAALDESDEFDYELRRRRRPTPRQGRIEDGTQHS